MNESAKAILDENVLGVLASINEDGSPWTTPLHFVESKGALYWFSAGDRVHSANLAREPRVSAAIFSPDTSHGLQGVYVSGKAELLGSEEHNRVHALFERRLGFVPPAFNEWNACKLPIGTLNEQKSTGNCWYFYT